MAGDVRYAITEPINEGPVYVLCPFHDDTKPSMAVYPDGTWCFVCNKGERAEEFLERVGWEGELPEYDAEAWVKRHGQYANLDQSNDLNVRAYTWHWTMMQGRRKQRLDWWIEERGLYFQTVRKHMLGHNGFAFSIRVAIASLSGST